MMMSVDCSSSSTSSSSKGSSGGQVQGQLESLRKTIFNIKALTNGFLVCFQGENSRLASFVDNVNFILEKQSGLSSGPGGNFPSGSGLVMSTAMMELSGGAPSMTATAEVESLKATLDKIHKQVDAFREVSLGNGDLTFLLQKLEEAIIASHSQLLSPSVRTMHNVWPSLPVPVRSLSSTSSHVEIIDLEPDLPDSTFEIETGRDVSPAVADDGIVNQNVKVESASAGETASVKKTATRTRRASSKNVEDVELPTCSSYLPRSKPHHRKRKTDSNVEAVVSRTKNVASKSASGTSKTAGVAPKARKTVPKLRKVAMKATGKNSAKSARPSLRSSRSDSHVGSDNNDATVEKQTFIQYNNVNLGKVKIEADYNPQPGLKEENSDATTADSDDVEMNDVSSPEMDHQQSSEGSSDPDVNNAVAQDVALNPPVPDEATHDQQNKDPIFGQNKILTTILKNLSVKDLKNVRFVNKQWKEMADARFIKEKLWKLIIDLKFGKKRYKGKTLEDLNDCIAIANSNGRFPLTALTFDYLTSQCYDYTKPSLLRFYNLHGPNITSLQLLDFRASIAVLHDLLLNRLPNVDAIYIHTIWFTQKGKLLTCRSHNKQELIPLPNLKKIHFKLDIDPRNKAHQDYFKAFLTSAVNLKEIKNVHSHMLPCIARVGKLECVKNFKFFPRVFIKAHTKTCGPNKKVSQFELPNDCVSFGELVELRPKLSILKINVQTFRSRELVPRYITGLNKILQSSKDSLKRLQIPSFFFVPDLILPNLKNLDHLEVYHSFSVKTLEPPEIFPGNLNLREMFPNLWKFSCFLVGIANETDWISMYFPLENTYDDEDESSSGRSSISSSSSSSSSGSFDPSRSFPSVTEFTFEYHYQFGKFLELYFPKLTHISCFKFDLTFPNGSHVGASCGLRETTIGIESLELCGFRFTGDPSRLDELFTGISRWECVRLNDGGDPSTAPAQPMNSHLLQNLKSLRRLKIIFDHYDNSKLKPSLPGGPESLVEQLVTYAVITPLSYRYAFALMENLTEIIFAYDHYLPASAEFAKIFQPFTAFPGVKIVHELNEVNAPA